MSSKPLVRLAFAHKDLPGDQPITIIAGDVGGTKTNIALFRVDHKGIKSLREARYASQEYKSLGDIVRHFAENEWPDRICMAVAGPVLDGKVKLTNLSWNLDSKVISESLKLPVSFINDLEANAYGLAGLHQSELAPIHKGELAGEGNICIIAAGTGLGEAGLYFDGEKYHPFAAEGGHCDFAPRTEQDVELWRFLHKQYGHVSWERVVSGPGIHTIFQFLTKAQRKPIPSWLQDQLSEADDSTAVISNAALQQAEPVCMEALQLFSRYLATEAACLVLKQKATGGCFLGGGIAPRLLSILQAGEWYKHFLDVGRMQPLLEQVPIYVILNPKTALLGSAYYGTYNM